jgi:hypothetical protein
VAQEGEIGCGLLAYDQLGVSIREFLAFRTIITVHPKYDCMTVFHHTPGKCTSDPVLEMLPGDNAFLYIGT